MPVFGEEITPEVKEVRVERQEVSASHPLQYKFTTFKTVKDINNADVQIPEKEEIVNTLQLDVEIEQLEKQKLDLQVRIDAIKAKQAEIGKL